MQTLLQYGAHFELKGKDKEEEDIEKPKKVLPSYKYLICFQFVYCRKVLDRKKGRAIKCVLARDNILYLVSAGETVITAYDTLSDQVMACLLVCDTPGYFDIYWSHG